MPIGITRMGPASALPWVGPYSSNAHGLRSYPTQNKIVYLEFSSCSVKCKGSLSEPTTPTHQCYRWPWWLAMDYITSSSSPITEKKEFCIWVVTWDLSINGVTPHHRFPWRNWFHTNHPHGSPHLVATKCLHHLATHIVSTYITYLLTYGTYPLTYVVTKVGCNVFFGFHYLNLAELATH